MAFVNLDDLNLLKYYDNIRDQVLRDSSQKVRLTDGPTIRQHADELHAEITKRRLQHVPINWHDR